MRVQNVQQGFVGPNGVFHPIRGSADYDEGRTVAGKAKAKKAKAAARKTARRKATTGLSTRTRSAGVRRNPESEVRELVYFVENDGRLDAQMYIPIIKNLANKKADGKYNKTLALKAFINLATEGAKRYHKEFGVSGDKWSDMFTVADRKAAAENFLAHFESELRHGNYDYLLNKKNAGKSVKNPLPIGKFIAAKVRMLKSGAVQVLVAGKAALTGGAGGRKRNPKEIPNKLPKLSDWVTIYDPGSNGKRTHYKYPSPDGATFDIEPSYTQYGRFSGYALKTWALFGYNGHQRHGLYSRHTQAYKAAQPLWKEHFDQTRKP